MRLSIGDNVVCIDNNGCPELLKDLTYYVIHTYEGANLNGILIDRVSPIGDYEFFNEARFIKIDMGFGSNVCEEIESLIKEDELILN